MPFPLEEAFVLEVERQLGARLPESYRVALMRSNGGTIVHDEAAWELHPIAETSDRKRVARTANHVLRETEVMHTWHGFPSHVLVIASDGSGNRMLLCRVDGKFEPAVLVWNHETRSLERIASDFSELTRSDLGGERRTRPN